jgi:hypothetical protein
MGDGAVAMKAEEVCVHGGWEGICLGCHIKLGAAKDVLEELIPNVRRRDGRPLLGIQGVSAGVVSSKIGKERRK